VKLRLDQNLSPRLARTLAVVYPGTTHVRDVGLQAADDDTVWAYVVHAEVLGAEVVCRGSGNSAKFPPKFSPTHAEARNTAR
jgi:Domain of unknown function (DUF5615)